jgi:hypothetical protein
MNAITFDPATTTLVNVLTCDPANQAALVDLLRQNTDAVIVTLDGWRSTSFVAAQDVAANDKKVPKISPAINLAMRPSAFRSSSLNHEALRP